MQIVASKLFSNVTRISDTFQKVVVMGLTLCHSNKRINQQCTLLFHFLCTVQQVRFYSAVIMDKLSTS